jgi:hypothetical protein
VQRGDLGACDDQCRPDGDIHAPTASMGEDGGEVAAVEAADRQGDPKHVGVTPQGVREVAAHGRMGDGVVDASARRRWRRRRSRGLDPPIAGLRHVDRPMDHDGCRGRKPAKGRPTR